MKVSEQCGIAASKGNKMVRSSIAKQILNYEIIVIKR